MITCPFCDEHDFDLIGLKIHLVHGHCDAYEQTVVNDAAEAQRVTPRLTVQPCPNCKGTGNEPEAGFADAPCQDCQGTGERPR